MDLPVYFDNHATTRCDPRVLDAMWPWFAERYGNAASRTHSFGHVANAAVEAARGQVAALIGASPKEIVWTSGATESDNLAVLGAARARRARGRHVITATTEHKAVLDPCARLESEGFAVTRLAVRPDGRVLADDVAAALRPDTVLVTLMMGNNEIGAVHPIAEIGALCKARGVLFHTDAAQAAGKLPIDVAALGVDLLSLSAHKMYGPKGIGALYVRRGRPKVDVEPILFGGGHERGLRSGTLAVPLIVGFGVAADLCAKDLADGSVERLRGLRDKLWTDLRARVDDVVLNGGWEHRLPNNLNVSFRGVEAEALMMAMRDVACSSGSACTSATLEPSHVLRALGIDPEVAHGSVRFGLGRFTTEDEVVHLVTRLAVEVPRLRDMNPMLEVSWPSR